MLQKTLTRIKVLPIITNILLNLFNDRNNSVITPFDNIQEYKVENSIDQGDTISSLLWRIFYNSFLFKISQMHSGYTVLLKFCKDIIQGWKLQHSNIVT